MGGMAAKNRTPFSAKNRSGADFEEEDLNVVGKKFKDASRFYQSAAAIEKPKLKRWLEKGREIQWDYKNIVKRKGVLERLK